MENAQEIREEVLRFFNDQHEDTPNQSPINEQDKKEWTFHAESSRNSLNNLDQATKFLDSQLINLGEFTFLISTRTHNYYKFR